MPPYHAILPTFAGGEFSPALYSRIDWQKYSTGLRTAKNFFIHPHGGASNRPGFEYIGATRNASQKSILVPFVFSDDQAYVIEMGQYYARFYKDGAVVPMGELADYPIVTDRRYVPGMIVADRSYLDIILKSSPFYALRIYAPPGVDTSTFTFEIKGATGYSVTTLVYNGSDAYTLHIGETATGTWIADLKATFAAVLPGWTVVATTNTVPRNFINVEAAPMTQSNTLWKCIRACDDVEAGSGYSKFPHGSTASNYWGYTDSEPIYEIATPYTEADLPNINFAQSADVVYLTHPDYEPRELARYADDNWGLDEFQFKNGPFMLSNSDTTKKMTLNFGASPTVVSSSPIFQSGHVGALFRLRNTVTGPSATGTIAGVNETVGPIECKGTWRLITHGTWTATIVLQRSLDGGATWTTFRTFNGAGDYNPDTYGEEDDFCKIRVLSTAWTSGNIGVTLSCADYDIERIAKITAVTSPNLASVSVTTPSGLTDPSSGSITTWEWAEGSWSDYRGWPSCVGFYQDRLCFGATNAEPQTIWASKTGNYTDFGRNIPLEDSDAMGINLLSRQLNRIRHIVPLSDILALTSSAQWKVGPADGTVFTPTSVLARLNSNGGSSTVPPVVVNNRVVYIQPMGGSVNDVAYNNDSGSYEVSDLSIFANHLFDGYSIISMAYQREPYNIIWAVRDDGTMLSLTYMREQDVVAWAHHETDGDFESVCCVPGNGVTELYAVVKRTIDGSEVRYIERLADRLASTEPEDQFFVDCGYTYSGTATTSITGLDWLEGETVAILADGSVLPQQTVTNGAITLSTAASKVIVGLPYTSDLETLNIEVGMGDGTLQGRKVKISSAILRLLNSSGGWVGPDSTHLIETNYGDRENYDEGVPLYSGDVEISLLSGYEPGGRILFRQIDPLPITILAIMPKITAGG